ncbi:hypothetical protein NPIL_564461 [Nephila pilipes]|uniref:Uncharacterized protein n=1 Tax=Nephila pilipes TaxID=299642 RepID=A0A8X6PSD1_NEPPI|nr:hypothetical protein NPIL_564461 [Nephila pilipes]
MMGVAAYVCVCMFVFNAAGPQRFRRMTFIGGLKLLPRCHEPIIVATSATQLNKLFTHSSGFHPINQRRVSSIVLKLNGTFFLRWLNELAGGCERVRCSGTDPGIAIVLRIPVDQVSEFRERLFFFSNPFRMEFEQSCARNGGKEAVGT